MSHIRVQMLKTAEHRSTHVTPVHAQSTFIIRGREVIYIFFSQAPKKNFEISYLLDVPYMHGTSLQIFRQCTLFLLTIMSGRKCNFLFYWSANLCCTFCQKIKLSPKNEKKNNKKTSILMVSAICEGKVVKNMEIAVETFRLKEVYVYKYLHICTRIFFLLLLLFLFDIVCFRDVMGLVI